MVYISQGSPEKQNQEDIYGYIRDLLSKLVQAIMEAMICKTCYLQAGEPEKPIF